MTGPTKTRETPWAALAALLMAAALPAMADQVYLTNGRMLDGEARKLASGMIEVQLSYGTLALPADRVARIVDAETLGEVVTETLDRLQDDDAEGRYQLAVALDARGENTLSQRLYEETLAIDPDHPGARVQLGYLRINGDWLTETEYRESRGEIFYRGEWVSARALAARVATQMEAWNRQQEQRRAAVREAELTATLGRLELTLDRLEGRPRLGDGLAAQPFSLYGSYGSYRPVYGVSVFSLVPKSLVSKSQVPHRPALAPAPTRQPPPSAPSAAPDRTRHHRGGLKKP